jgi:hypothetical protein
MDASVIHPASASYLAATARDTFKNASCRTLMLIRAPAFKRTGHAGSHKAGRCRGQGLDIESECFHHKHARESSVSLCRGIRMFVQRGLNAIMRVGMLASQGGSDNHGVHLKLDWFK